MAKLSLTKGGLHNQREELRLFQRMLPSLDLKRMQLKTELARARDQLAAHQVEVDELNRRVAEQLPMLANREIDVSGLVKVSSVQIEVENVVGVKLPSLREVVCTIQEYSMLAKPHWVDLLVEQLKTMAELHARVKVAAERVRLLERAVRRITQRVNLFDKVLIPTAMQNIQKIKIFLGDAERAAVSRAKMAKSMHERQRRADTSEGAPS
jgi:V/A-type H+-transporting ATPase subunit D